MIAKKHGDDFERNGLTENFSCASCELQFDILIVMHHYATNESNIVLCTDCAKQLARKILEDICEIDTKSGRHG